jgi:hypothetical protein
VALVETIPTTIWLRSLGLKLAASLRRPVEVTGRDGEPVRVRLEIGVGIVHLSPRHPEVEDVLDDAQRLAQAARQMRSRAAMADPATGEPLAVEEVPFGKATFARAAPRAPRPVSHVVTLHPPAP